jgi:hypothetical protein
MHADCVIARPQRIAVCGLAACGRQQTLLSPMSRTRTAPNVGLSALIPSRYSRADPGTNAPAEDAVIAPSAFHHTLEREQKHMYEWRATTVLLFSIRPKTFTR